MTVHHSEAGFRFISREEDMQPREPQTPEEWQMCADTCAGLRLIVDCKMYGLLGGGPKIDVDRVDYLLNKATEQGIFPLVPAAEVALYLIQCWNREQALRG